MSAINDIDKVGEIKARRHGDADIDFLIEMLEGFVGAPTALETGADVDEVIDRFIEAHKGLFDHVDTQEFMDEVRGRDDDG